MILNLGLVPAGRHDQAQANRTGHNDRDDEQVRPAQNRNANKEDSQSQPAGDQGHELQRFLAQPRKLPGKNIREQQLGAHDPASR